MELIPAAVAATVDCHEFVVGAGLDDFAAFEDEDLVGAADDTKKVYYLNNSSS